jgi:hypothetical protein
MSATHSLNCTASLAPVLCVAFELSSGQWKLASTTARGQRARVVSVQASNTAAVLSEGKRTRMTELTPIRNSEPFLIV